MKWLDEMIELPVAFAVGVVVAIVTGLPFLPWWVTLAGSVVSIGLYVYGWRVTRRADQAWTSCPYCATRVRCNVPGVAVDVIADHVRTSHAEVLP